MAAGTPHRWNSRQDLHTALRAQDASHFNIQPCLLQGTSDGSSAGASTSGPGTEVPEKDRPRHKLYASSIRAGLAAEAAASQLYAGQRAAGCSQPDVRMFEVRSAALADAPAHRSEGRLQRSLLTLVQEKGQALLHRLQKVAPTYRTRPSVVAPASSAAAFALGAVSAALPTNLRRAVTGARHPRGYAVTLRSAA